MGSHGLRERARELAPTLADRAETTERMRCVPQETIKDFHEAGLFRALQPKRFGGIEADPGEFFDAVLEIGAACASSAWVLSVVAVHSWQLALFPDEAQQDVWGEDDTVLMSSSYAPTGKIEPIEGGYQLSGRWTFSSGCDSAGWVLLGGVVPGPANAPPPPDMRTFLVPQSDFVIDDTWHVAGLSGSGSKDIVIKGAFVPEHRTHAFRDVLVLDNPGNAVNQAPLFRIPFGAVFCNAVSMPALGTARGALERFVDVTRARVFADMGRAVDDASTQIRLAEGEAALDGVYLQMQANFAEMMDLARRGEKPTLQRRARYRWDASRAARVASECIDSLFEASGSKAIFLDNPLQRAFRDVHAMRAHNSNNAERTAQIYARSALGFPNKEFLL